MLVHSLIVTALDLIMINMLITWKNKLKSTKKALINIENSTSTTCLKNRDIEATKIQKNEKRILRTIFRIYIQV